MMKINKKDLTIRTERPPLPRTGVGKLFLKRARE